MQKAQKPHARLRMKTAIFLVMILLTSCNAAGCNSFHQIRDLTESQKESLRKSDLPLGWIQDIADFKETYKRICQ